MYFSQLQLFFLLAFKLSILGQWEPLFTWNPLPRPLSLETTFPRFPFPMWVWVGVCQWQELMQNLKVVSGGRSHYSQEFAVTRLHWLHRPVHELPLQSHCRLSDSFSNSSRILAFQTDPIVMLKTLVMWSSGCFLSFSTLMWIQILTTNLFIPIIIVVALLLFQSGLIKSFFKLASESFWRCVVFNNSYFLV